MLKNYSKRFLTLLILEFLFAFLYEVQKLWTTEFFNIFKELGKKRNFYRDVCPGQHECGGSVHEHPDGDLQVRVEQARGWGQACGPPAGHCHSHACSRESEEELLSFLNVSLSSHSEWTDWPSRRLLSKNLHNARVIKWYGNISFIFVKLFMAFHKLLFSKLFFFLDLKCVKLYPYHLITFQSGCVYHSNNHSSSLIIQFFLFNFISFKFMYVWGYLWTDAEMPLSFLVDFSSSFSPFW